MKIFYAVQATGNGHISRAIELLPELQEHGQVDIFLSGNNCQLALDLPIRFRSQGVSLHYTANGGLDYWKIMRNIRPFALEREINELPIEDYDLVIHDFELITSAAARRKNIPCIQVGHQASFHSALTPRPARKSYVGEWLIKNYARADEYIGLHFDRYDNSILPPVIGKTISNAEPVDNGHITIYLPAFSELFLKRILEPIKGVSFHIFSKETKKPTHDGNLYFLPVDKNFFQQSLITCHGIITGAGFETPAEALYLGKKIMAVPARGQYEQLCNAAALERLQVPTLSKFDDTFHHIFWKWLYKPIPKRLNFEDPIPEMIKRLLAFAHRRNSMDLSPANSLIAVN